MTSPTDAAGAPPPAAPQHDAPPPAPLQHDAQPPTAVQRDAQPSTATQLAAKPPATTQLHAKPSTPAHAAPGALTAGAPPAVAASGPSALAAGTTAADPLAELRGLHLPDPVGAWPPAPGWWGLAALVVVCSVATTFWIRRRRRSVVRHALRELDGLARGTSDGDLQALATRLAALVRRVALLRFGRARVAGLHGSAWQQFLAETAPRKRRRRGRFADDAGLVLALAPYAPAGASCLTRNGVAIDRRVLIAATRAWIEENA